VFDLWYISQENSTNTMTQKWLVMVQYKRGVKC